MLFIAFHFFPIFLAFIGIFPAIYFFHKIKLMQYRLFAVLKYIVIVFMMSLIIEDLKHVFFTASTSSLGESKSTKVGKWEVCNVLILTCFISSDLVIYYLYTHTKIVVSDTQGKFYRMVAFLAKDSKIYRSTLKFAGFVLLIFLIFLEIILKDDSAILSLMKEYIRN